MSRQAALLYVVEKPSLNRVPEEATILLVASFYNANRHYAGFFSQKQSIDADVQGYIT